LKNSNAVKMFHSTLLGTLPALSQIMTNTQYKIVYWSCHFGINRSKFRNI